MQRTIEETLAPYTVTNGVPAEPVKVKSWGLAQTIMCNACTWRLQIWGDRDEAKKIAARHYHTRHTAIVWHP